MGIADAYAFIAANLGLAFYLTVPPWAIPADAARGGHGRENGVEDAPEGRPAQVAEPPVEPDA